MSAAHRPLDTLARTAGTGLLVLAMAASRSVGAAGPPQAPPAATALKVIDLREPDGQVLSYRHLADSTEVQMRGTRLAPEARVKLKIGSRPGFVELDINRGGITGLKPASRLGRDFLTYVLWAVSVDGRASNLGEITFDGDAAVAVNLTTPYQTFWLMATAEPNYAVVEPSALVVLYSVKQRPASDARAMPITTDLFYFTRYATYAATPGGAPDGVPNQLLQARKAIELAARSAVLSPPHSGTGLKEETYAREALGQARTFLARAEDAYRRNPRGQEVIQFARTAAQSAENARALAMGVVGGILAHQLETELVTVRGELDRIKAGDPAAGQQPAATSGGDALRAGTPAAADAGEGSTEISSLPAVLKRPAMWFALSGWAVALALLFRRRSV
jgi:hypothetical protein